MTAPNRPGSIPTTPNGVYAQAHAHAAPTERAAQQRIAPKAGQLRARVLELVAEAGDDGLTATEAYERYVARWGEPRGGLYSLAPRLSELERRGGWARKSGAVRDNRAAYVVTEVGQDWATGGAA